jgi:probable selenium-dependent hydroxylase accessory protein YqeC
MRAWFQNNSIWQETTSLSEALGLKGLLKGNIAVIGAGGKTTAIFQLAKEFVARDLKVIITTTTRMFREPGILATTSQEARELLKNQSIVIVGSPVENGKISGLVEEQAYELTQIADIVLVEADGSKRFPLKVPADHEPVIPSGTDRIVLVAGLSGIGTRLSMSCHRAELTAELLEVPKEHMIQPEDIGRMIRKGYLENAILGNSQVTVLLNQADDTELRRSGEEIAKLLTPYSCVIANLKE